MTYCVYWIREKSHTDLMSQGYIGVSSNAEKRFMSHKEMNRGTNAHLRHAIAKGRRWYNNGTNIAFCFEGQQPDGYVLGRKSLKFVKEK